MAVTPSGTVRQRLGAGRIIDDIAAGRPVRLVAWGTPVLCAALVLFQAALPTAGGGITVNLSDPLAILGALTLISLSISGQGWRRLWRVPHMNVALTASALVMLLGFVHGVAVFGVTDWALFNRLIGFAILISFLLTGALMTAIGGQAGTATLCRVFVVMAAAVVGAEIGLRLLDDFVSVSLFDWNARFEGMAGNPNAFAAQLALAAAVALPVPYLFVRQRSGLVEAVVLGLVTTGIFLASSRAAWGALVCVIALNLFLGRFDKLRLVRGLIGAALIVVVIVLTGLVAEGGAIQLNPAGYKVAAPNNPLLYVAADRWLSLAGGFQMWLENPLFGAGLGAFIHQQLGSTGTPLVIHNTVLWLAAEFGIAGLLVVAFLPASVTLRLLTDRAWRDEWSGPALLGCLGVIGVMSLAHELFYQRAFWLLAGGLIALPGSLRPAFCAGDG